MVFQYNTPQGAKLDPIDDQLLQGVDERKTLQEMGRATGRSWANVRDRLKALEEAGYIEYTPGKARMRKLTPLANDYLQANGLRKQELFR